MVEAAAFRICFCQQMSYTYFSLMRMCDDTIFCTKLTKITLTKIKIKHLNVFKEDLIYVAYCCLQPNNLSETLDIQVAITTNKHQRCSRISHFLYLTYLNVVRQVYMLYLSITTSILWNSFFLPLECPYSLINALTFFPTFVLTSQPIWVIVCFESCQTDFFIVF